MVKVDRNYLKDKLYHWDIARRTKWKIYLMEKGALMLSPSFFCILQQVCHMQDLMCFTTVKNIHMYHLQHIWQFSFSLIFCFLPHLLKRYLMESVSEKYSHNKLYATQASFSVCCLCSDLFIQQQIKPYRFLSCIYLVQEASWNLFSKKWWHVDIYNAKFK